MKLQYLEKLENFQVLGLGKELLNLIPKHYQQKEKLIN